MATESLRVRDRGIWELVNKQHGVISRLQLRDQGLSPEAIRHRLARGRLWRVMPGVYAVGRPVTEERGLWMAAVLACGPDALLSHRSAAALLGIREPGCGPIEVVVPARVARRRAGLHVYRRAVPKPGGDGVEDRAIAPRVYDSIPVTGPAVVLTDLATCLPTWQLEAAVNEADHLDLIDPERLRSAIDGLPRRPGVRCLRRLLDSSSETLTASALEHHFLPLTRSAGLPLPVTQSRVGSHRVDFFWAELGLIVETDSIRYHRTPFKQAADARRDNAHAGSGLTTLRFTHGQVRHEPAYVQAQLQTTAARLFTTRQGGATRTKTVARGTVIFRETATTI